MKLHYEFQVVKPKRLLWWRRLWAYLGSFITVGSKRDT
jgi:hypothetical protein